MRKSIVICIDGTGNDPTDASDPRENRDTTNVFRFSKALIRDERQLVSYHKGLATSQKKLLDRISHVTGLGANELCSEAYAFLAANYVPGDAIYLVGFSRGAAIARDLANDIYDERLDRVGRAPIRGVLLWDTVAAFGIPRDIGSIGFQRINIGKKLDIPPNVEQTVHLLAIDERQNAFKPTQVKAADNVEEVWFAGAHGDVGGGFKDRELAEITLRFMIERAQAMGLRFHQSALDAIPVKDGVDGDFEPEKKGEARAIKVCTGDWVGKSDLETTLRPKIHATVVKRIREVASYNPENVAQLHGNYEIVA